MRVDARGVLGSLRVLSLQHVEQVGEVELSEPLLVGGIVRQHILFDDAVVDTRLQELEGKARIAGAVEGLGQTQVYHRATVNVDITRAVLGKRGILDA